MIKLLILLMALTLVLSTHSLSFANGFGQGLNYPDSPHNFSTDPDVNPTTEICRVCHVPHDHNVASQRYLNGLLWNHKLSSSNYTMYSSNWSSTLDNAQSLQPDGIAKLCLGCHDGTISLDAFGNNNPSGYTMHDREELFVIPGFSNGSQLDLRGTHPISIVFDNTIDTNLHDPDTTVMGNSGYISDVLDNGKVQCSSCHDVHDQESVPGTRLLRVSQQGSGLCLTCHIK